MTQESIEQNTENNLESPTDLQLGNRSFADFTDESEAPEEPNSGITPSGDSGGGPGD